MLNMLPTFYNKNNGNQYEDNKKSITTYQHLLKWNKNENILEIGPGDGRTTKELLFPIFPKDFREYIGIDISKNNVQYLKNHIKNEKCNFYHIDIGTDDIPQEFENRFDHIFCFLCLHWVKDSRKAVENIYNMLKPGGQLFGNMHVDGISAALMHGLNSYPRWQKYNHGNHISVFWNNGAKNYFEDWKNAFINCGLQNQLSVWWPSIYEFTEKNFEAFIFAANPVLGSIKEDEMNDYKYDYLEVSKKIGNRIDNSNISITFNLALFVFTKPL